MAASRRCADCSLGVAQAEVFGLLGPNGAGKTTLLRLLMGYLRPTSGAATIGGLDCYRQSTLVHRLTSYLPGEAHLPSQMGATCLILARMRGRGTFDRSLALAERLELETAPGGEMLTGMRQKLALSAVLAAEVPLAILDEPTSNLDPTMRAEVSKLVRSARPAAP